MVQRKVSNKLGIQADHVKSEKRLVNLKPSSYQYQDGKNRGPDMKKKMKKSRSFKLSDIESLRSSPLKQTISQPGKPPTFNVPSMATTPQKQSPVKTVDGSPNYMKSTSSSEARKESSQVSSRYSQTGSDIKNQRRRNSSNSKLSSGSSTKPARTLTKSSSLKLVRTLTRTPSFKPLRASAKKCSRVVIYADMNAQRATCSSTLKDSKFPDYLTLSPGATEAEGTSAMKVCPYTYCSLNGHHHKPLPPLKCFLSARRRLLKTQRSIKLEALSPRRVKPVSEGAEENGVGQVMFYDNSSYKGGDLDCSPSSPLIKEGGMNFFIEIYARNKERNVESPFGGCDEAKMEHNNHRQVAESLSDGSPHSEIDFEENLELDSEIVPIGVDITSCVPQEQNVKNPEKDCLPTAAQNEALPESFYNGSNYEKECKASTEGNDGISEVSDMESEEGQLSTSELDTADNYSDNDHKESDLDDWHLSEIKNHDFHDEPIIKSDNIIFYCSEEIVADEVLEEQSACLDPQRDDSDSEMEDAHQNLGIVEFGQVSVSLSYERQSSMEKACQEEPIVEPPASNEEIQEMKGVPEADDEIHEMSPQLGDVETYYTPKVTDESLNDQQEEKSFQDDEITVLLQNPISDSLQNSDQTYHVATDEDYNVSLEPEDSLIDHNVAINAFDLELEIPKGEAGNQTEETEQVAVAKRSIGVQVDIYPVAVSKVSVGVQAPEDFYEANQVDAKVDTDPCQLEDFGEEGTSSQDIIEDILSGENQEQPSEGEYDSMNVADNQNFVEKDEDKDEVNRFKIASSMDSEQSDSRMHKISLVESNTGETEKMEVEDSIRSDINETIPMTGSKTNTELESTSFLLESKSNQELASTCGNHKWKIGCKRPINDEEDLRGFNPREPNYLPVVPDPDAEKVDLRHQMEDERKNAEEWMVDYALRQTVTKLAAARKKKVALLVEAFETVMPTPKWKTHARPSPAAIAPARPIQACS